MKKGEQKSQQEQQAGNRKGQRIDKRATRRNKKGKVGATKVSSSGVKESTREQKGAT